jgi:flavodoxin
MSDFFQIFIFSIISFAISIFISDKFKFSKNKFIKILQKLVFTNIILALFGFIGYLLDVSIFNIIFCDNDDEIGDALQETQNPSTSLPEGNIKKEKDILHITTNTEDKEYYNFKIKKEVINNIWEKGTDIIMSGVKDLGPNLGIGAAVGKVGSEIIKHTAGMAPAPRIAMVGTTALATAAGTKIGIELGKALIENKKRVTEIEANKLDTIDISGENSPTEFDGGFIHSVLDTNEIEIPLLTMVNGLCYLNYIEFILILGLFSLLFLRQCRKFLIRKLIGLILKLKGVHKGSYKKKKNLSWLLCRKWCNSLVLKDSKKLRSSCSALPVSPNLRVRREGTRRLNKRSFINSYKNLSLNNTLKSVDKYTNYLTVFIFVCLIWIKFINIYFSSNFAADIDSFVNVYNHIKKQ